MLKTIKKSFSFIKKKYAEMNLAVKAGIWFTICSIIQRGLSVITLPIFTRIMSTEEYGEYSIFFTWFTILQLLVTLNIQSEVFNKGLIEHIDKKDSYTANQAGLLIILNIIFLLLLIIFKKTVSKIMDIPFPLLIIMLLEILGSAELSLWYARKRFDYEYKKLVLMTILVSVMTPLLGIFAVILSPYKAEAKIVSNAAVPIFVSILLVIGFSKKGKLFSGLHWWKTTLIAAIPLLPHYLSLVLLNQSDKLMIDYFLGKEEAAIYSVAHSAGLLMTIVNNSVNGSFVPWAYGRLKFHKGEGIPKIADALMGIVVFVNVLLIWVAPEAVGLLAPKAYHEAVWCLVPLAMSVFFYFVYTLFVDMEIYYGGNSFIAVASVIAAILNIVLNYIFVPIFGYIAAGYTTLISYFTTMILHYSFMKITMMRNKINLKLFNIKMIVIFTVILIILSGMAMLLYPFPFIRYGIILVTVIIVIMKKNSMLRIFKLMKNKEL